MASPKTGRTRLTFDFFPNDIKAIEKLQEMYDLSSKVGVVRNAIMRDLVLGEMVKNGGTIQLLKPDGVVESIVFVDWMPFLSDRITNKI